RNVTGVQTCALPICQRPRNFPEPVGCAVGDDDDVALGDAARLTAGDGGAANFIWFNGFAVDDAAAGDERRGAVEDVDDVGVFGRSEERRVGKGGMFW